VWLLLRDPESLGVTERRALGQVLEASDEGAVIYPLIQRFGKMVRHREAEDFDGWLQDALSCGVKDFETFAMGFKRERSAVEAALKLPYSNGQTEGQINRLKLIKRSMYGRANFDLLRQRVLGAA
jgi:transposase